MLKLFSPCIFAPDGIEADLERRVISGGTALNGEEDVIATDGGGRWFFQLSDPYLDEPDIAQAWRAMSAYCGPGRPVIVAFCDPRHQPAANFVTVPHSDGTPFSDDTEYAQGGAIGRAVADAALRATTLTIDTATFEDDLVGGERFTIVHDTLLDRAYEISEIIAVDGDNVTVTFEPPLREAIAAGASIDFANPRCVMRLDGDMRSPTNMGYAESDGARFVEHFPGDEGYP